MDINILVMVFYNNKVLALKGKDSSGKTIYSIPSGSSNNGGDLIKRAGSIAYSAIRRRVKNIAFVKDIAVGREVTLVYRAELPDSAITVAEGYTGYAWLGLDAAALEEKLPFLVRGVCTYIYGLNQIARRNAVIAADAAHNKCLSLSGEGSAVRLADGNTVYKVKKRNYCYLTDSLAAFKLVGDVAKIFCAKFGYINKGGYKGSDWYNITLNGDTDISVLLDMLTLSYEQTRI